MNLMIKFVCISFHIKIRNSLSRCVFSTGYRYVLVCSLKKMRNVHFDYCLFFMSSHFHYRNLIEPAYRDILDINDVLVDVSLELLRRIIS